MCSDVSFFIQQATFNNRYLGLYLQSGAVQLLGLFKMGVFFCYFVWQQKHRPLVELENQINI